MGDTVKHTPGPWYAIPNPEWSGAKWRIDNKSNAPWANFGEICYASTAANARLIAAAPTMYDYIEDSAKTDPRAAEILEAIHVSSKG